MKISTQKQKSYQLFLQEARGYLGDLDINTYNQLCPIVAIGLMFNDTLRRIEDSLDGIVSEFERANGTKDRKSGI